MHPLEKAYENKDYRTMGWMLWHIFLTKDMKTDERQFAIMLYDSLSRRERALLENT